MKIIKGSLKYGKPFLFEEDITFSKDLFGGHHLRDIKSCHAKVEATMYDDFIRMEVELKVDAICADSYNLKDVDLKLNIKDELLFSENEDDETMFYEPNQTIELDEYILGIIVSNIPIKVTGKDSKLPENGSGYRVLSEDDYLNEKKNKKDDRWPKLDELDLD